MSKFFTPKATLPTLFGIEILAWMLIRRNYDKYSMPGLIDIMLFAPSVFGVLLLLINNLYPYGRVLKFLGILLLIISCFGYVVLYGLFSDLSSWHMNQDVFLTMVPLVLDVLILLSYLVSSMLAALRN